MQLEKVLHRFPELRPTDFASTSSLEVTGLEYTRHFVQASVLDRRTWSAVDLNLSVEDQELFVDCECEKFAGADVTQCEHICELLEHLQWTEFPWPAGPLRIQRDDARPTWKRLFSKVREFSREQDEARLHEDQQLFFVIDLPEALEESELVVQVYQSKLGQRGQMLKPRLRAPVQLLRNGGLSKVQRDALQLLDSVSGGTGYYGFAADETRIRLGYGAQQAAISAMGQTGQLYWTLDDPGNQDSWTKLAWSPTPWAAKVTVEQLDDGWRFDAILRQGDRVRPLSEVSLFMSSGLVFFSDEVAPTDSLSESIPWLLGIQQTGPFVVPDGDTSDMLKMLYSAFGAANAIELPQPLQYRRSTGVPTPRVQFGQPARGSRQLPLTVDFMYDEQAARKDYGAIHHDQRELVLRDHEAEEQHLETLEQAGVERSGLRLHADQLPSAVAFLSAAGWQVEADGKLVRTTSKINIAVQSGLDWFDLDGVFKFDNSEVSMPRVLSAMRRGDKYVKLDDGSHGLLPEEWLQRFAPIAQLGEADGDTIRFSMPQAVFLDAMLSAQEDVQVDSKFAAYRKKLASFDGIKPGKARRNFRGTLRPYQEDGLGWLKFLREFGLGGCLADDMGLGKTVQVLAMLQGERQRRLKGDERRLPSLIVAPRSLLFNWMEESSKFTPNLKVLEYFGLERESLREEIFDHDIVVTTYGIVRRDIEFLVEQSFHYVILDEAQAIKNSSSQASKACRLLHGRHRLALTGTPIENHLGELWSLFEFINPGMMGRNETFMSLARRASGDEEARQMIAAGVRPYVLRRNKEEVLKDLPAKTENTLICEMGSQQRQAYDELREYYRKLLSKKVETQGLKRSKIHVLEALLRLRQCACHPQLLNPNETLPSAKLDTLMAQLESIIDEGHKALVFSQFTKLLSIVRDQLDGRAIPYEYLDGRTRKRKERVQAFQENPDCPLFLISLKAGGHGLNLTAADYVFILDPWWNPAVEAQAVDRAHRIGQQKPVFAYRLICKDTVEEKIVKLQQEKKQLADSIISADASLMQSLTADDLAMLLS